MRDEYWAYVTLIKALQTVGKTKRVSDVRCVELKGEHSQIWFINTHVQDAVYDWGNSGLVQVEADSQAGRKSRAMWKSDHYAYSILHKNTITMSLPMNLGSKHFLKGTVRVSGEAAMFISRL